MNASPPRSQPKATALRQDAPLWELQRQDDYADHEFSFWRDGEIVVLANPAFGRDDALQEMVDGLNSHASLKARVEELTDLVAFFTAYFDDLPPGTQLILPADKVARARAALPQSSAVARAEQERGK